MNLGLGLVKAELTADAPEVGGFDGDRLPGSPNRTVNFGFKYDYSIFNSPAYVGADYAYVGGFFSNLQESGAEAGDYSRINTKAGIRVGPPPCPGLC